MFLSPGPGQHDLIRKARQVPSVQGGSTPLFLTDEGWPKFHKFFRTLTGAQPAAAPSIFKTLNGLSEKFPLAYRKSQPVTSVKGPLSLRHLDGLVP